MILSFPSPLFLSASAFKRAHTQQLDKGYFTSHKQTKEATITPVVSSRLSKGRDWLYRRPGSSFSPRWRIKDSNCCLKSRGGLLGFASGCHRHPCPLLALLWLAHKWEPCSYLCCNPYCRGFIASRKTELPNASSNVLQMEMPFVFVAPGCLCPRLLSELSLHDVSMKVVLHLLCSFPFQSSA